MELLTMILTAGDPAPEFSAITHEGKNLTLSSMRGRKVFLWFFPEAGTPGCTTEGRGIRDHRSYFEENNIAVVGISLDAIEDNAAFAHKNDFWFPLLCDASHTIAIAYGACETAKDSHASRISFLIDESGIISRVYDKVDPRDHAAQVLADILGV